MDIKNFLKTVCEQIKYKPVRESISEEIKAHIEEIKEDLIDCGINSEDAERRAINQMGSAEEIGKKLNKIHKPKLDWKLLILIIILIGFGLIVSIVKEMSINNNQLKHTIFYTIIGIFVGICIYFFDYRKIKKHSNMIYIIATIIMILPLFGIGGQIMGRKYLRIGGIINFFPPVVTMPLYLISFVGFITDYKKDNFIKLKILEEVKINKDFVKISISSILSLMLMSLIPSITNMIILAISYLIIITVKIIQNKEDTIKRVIKIYGSISIIAIVFIIQIIVSPYKFSRIIVSFNPEKDPSGSGYVGMLQKQILENAKIIGTADTRVITSDEFLISMESHYTFIYILRKNGNINYLDISTNNYFKFSKINYKCKKYKR